MYAYVADAANLASWASGVSDAAGVTFAPRNDFGVLDHRVALPSGETVYVPMRVLAIDDAAEVVFTLRRQAGTSDDEFASDAEAVRADLSKLKQVLEL